MDFIKKGVFDEEGYAEFRRERGKKSHALEPLFIAQAKILCEPEIRRRKASMLDYQGLIFREARKLQWESEKK